MSVEKYKPEFENGRLKHQSKPYTLTLNKVLQDFTHIDALSVWCYLQSLPENWVISPKHLQKHFGVGEEKIYNILRKLICANLLLRTRQLCANGTYSHTIYTVLNGENFVNIQKDIKKPAKKVTVAHPHLTIPHLTIPDVANRGTTNTNKNKKTNIYKKDIKSYYASDDAHDIAFTVFWLLYPRKKDKKRAEQLWDKKTNDERVLILEDVKNRIAQDAQWQDHNFIPHPSTYLNGERWHDDITKATPAIQKEDHVTRAIRSAMTGLERLN